MSQWKLFVPTLVGMIAASCTNGSAAPNDATFADVVAADGADRITADSVGDGAVTTDTTTQDVAMDGCSADLSNDPHNCGVCGHQCPSTLGTPACIAGVCGYSACAAGTTLCANACVDPQSDTNNCGTCGHACPGSAGTPLCTEGACHYSSCGGGLTLCAGDCVYTLGDANNCGACGHVCPGIAGGTPVCTSGTCGGSCPSGEALCSSTRVPATSSGGLECSSPGTNVACTVPCQSTPGTQPCSSSCSLGPTCTPATTHWAWNGSDPVWAHGCGSGPTGTLWCASYATTCYLLFGNYRTDMPPGHYTAHFQFGVGGSPLTVYGVVVHPDASGGTLLCETPTTASAVGGPYDTQCEFTVSASDACAPIEFRIQEDGGPGYACAWSVSVDWAP